MRVKKLKANISFKRNSIFAVIILIFLLQAYLHDKNIVYLFVFFVIGVVVINNIFLKKNLKDLEIELLGVQNPFAKEESLIVLKVTNPTNRDKFDIWIDRKVNFSIEANSTKRVYLKRTFKKRGLVNLIKIEISSAFPLNMFDRYYSVLEFKKEIIIYPQKKGISLKALSSKTKAPFGERDDFKGLREYQSGDKASLINWKSLSKRKLSTKEFEHQKESNGYIFDINSLSGSLEDKLSQLTLWAVEANSKKENFLIVLNRVTLNSKQNTLDEILSYLALYQEKR